MSERAGLMSNGLHRVFIDDEARVVSVIASEAWRVELVPARSGHVFVEESEPAVRVPTLEDGPLGLLPGARAFVCGSAMKRD